MTGAGCRDRHKLVTAFQAAHRKYLIELPPKSFSRAIAVSTGTMPSGVWLLNGPVEIFTLPGGAGWRDQTVDHGVILPQQRATGSHAGKDLIDMLRLHRAGDFTDHRRLVPIARPSPRESALSISFAYSRISATALATSGILTIRHQHVSFRRRINGAGVFL